MDPHPTSLTHLRRQLLLGMGISALAACSPSTGSDPADVEPDDAPEAVAEGVTLRNLGTPAREHLNTMRIRHAPAGSTLTLNVGVTGQDPHTLLEPLAVGTATADPDGKAEIRWLVPAVRDADRERLRTHVQVSIDDGGIVLYSDILELSLQDVSPDVDLDEAHPGLTAADFVGGPAFRACMPHTVIDLCPSMVSTTAWDVLEVANYALQSSIPGDYEVGVCHKETAFPDDCCFGLVLASGDVAPTLDACGTEVDDTARDTGGRWVGGSGAEDGRPFTVDGAARCAEVCTRLDWADERTVPLPRDEDVRGQLIAAWIRAGQAEHASVASFSRFNIELMALGAPSHLLARSTVAIADEIRHARTCFGVASALAGRAIGPGPLAVSGCLADRIDPHAVLVAAILEGCIGETIASVQVREAALGTDDPQLAAALTGIADDEARHAELSWAVVRWILATHPELRGTAAQTFAGFSLGHAPPQNPLAAELARGGALSSRDRHLVAERVWSAVIVPCAQSLLAYGPDTGRSPSPGAPIADTRRAT